MKMYNLTLMEVALTPVLVSNEYYYFEMKLSTFLFRKNIFYIFIKKTHA